MEKLEIENEVEKIPKKSGIYYYFDKENQLLYVGKAANLHFRTIEHIKNFRDHEKGKKMLNDLYSKRSLSDIVKFDSHQRSMYDLVNCLYQSGNVIDKILDRVKTIKVEEFQKEVLKQREDQLIQTMRPLFNSQTACEEYYNIGKDFHNFERELLKLFWE